MDMDFPLPRFAFLAMYIVELGSVSPLQTFKASEGCEFVHLLGDLGCVLHFVLCPSPFLPFKFREGSSPPICVFEIETVRALFR